MQVRKQQLELDMEQWTQFKIGKGVCQGCILSPCLFNCHYGLVDAKAYDCVDHNKLWKILKEMGIPDRLTCLLRNLYAGQEAKLELDMKQ